MRSKILTEDYEISTEHDDKGRDWYGTDAEYGLMSWNYRPNKFIQIGRNKFHERFGLELEIDKGTFGKACCETIRALCPDNVYLKHDGSLINGIEIVSMPSTLASHKNPKVIPWKKILDTAGDCGFRSHNAQTCGLHIHVDRQFFGDTKFEKDINIAKVILLFDKFWDNIVKFSRRKNSDLNQWCKRYHWITPTFVQTYANKPNELTRFLIDQLDYCGNGYGEHDERYHAVNIQNANTIEFRIFRGTLRYTTFIACIEFVSDLIHYARVTSVQDILKTEWLDIFGNTEHKELKEYLIEKELYFNPSVINIPNS